MRIAMVDFGIAVRDGACDDDRWKLKMQAFNADVQDRILALVKAILEQNAIAAEVHPESRLVDVGLTSMDMVNLMLGVEAEFDFTIPQGRDHAGEFPVGQNAGTDDRPSAAARGGRLTGKVAVVVAKLSNGRPRRLNRANMMLSRSDDSP